VEFFQSVFGEYPFETVGAIINPAPKINYALETQTKPVYPFRPNEPLLAHEIAHQWFGNDVTLSSWPEIWLNEGFATWAQWFWRERNGDRTVQQTFRKWYRLPAKKHWLWNPPPGDPGKAATLFSTSIYLRGGMTLQALRKKMGTEAFLELLREWIADHRYGNASIAEFIAMAEEKADQELDHFFEIWLFKRGKPRNW
jgi:aminopeptidase N